MSKHWLEAFRLRTLPLAWSCIGMGGILTALHAQFDTVAFLLVLLTATLLQILSNLANDYGDYRTGLDGEHRVGPQRTVQAGKITAPAMRRMMGLFAGLSLVSGLLLLFRAAYGAWYIFGGFLGLGLLAILAAIAYTVGKRPYGYAGLGDIAVLIFFGWVGVGGTFFLLAQEWHAVILLPASSCGLLGTAVLNVNNIRDIDADRQSGKRSLPVRMGRSKAVLYHYALLAGALGCALVYVLLTPFDWPELLFLLSAPLLWRNAQAVQRYHDPEKLDPYLKQLALSTVAFVLLFGLGQWLR